MKIKSRGFTLIELLIVIAIIGILSSVVLASLNIARGKGADTGAKADLNGIRSQAEIVNDNNHSYDAVCTDPNIVNAISAAALKEGLTWASVADNTDNISCTNSTNEWMTFIQLPKGAGATSWWCVDNLGKAELVNTIPGVAATTCP